MHAYMYIHTDIQMLLLFNSLVWNSCSPQIQCTKLFSYFLGSILWFYVLGCNFFSRYGEVICSDFVAGSWCT